MRRQAVPPCHALPPRLCRPIAVSTIVFNTPPWATDVDLCSSSWRKMLGSKGLMKRYTVTMLIHIMARFIQSTYFSARPVHPFTPGAHVQRYPPKWHQLSSWSTYPRTQTHPSTCYPCRLVLHILHKDGASTIVGASTMELSALKPAWNSILQTCHSRISDDIMSKIMRDELMQHAVSRNLGSLG